MSALYAGRIHPKAVGLQLDHTRKMGDHLMARIRECDLVIPALRALAGSPGGTITTSELIGVLEIEFAPEGQDAEKLDGRNDTYFSQKVRNLVSHRDSGTSMFTKGYATYHAPTESITITDAGRRFLDQVPE